MTAFHRVGVSWNARYTARYRRHRAQVRFPPSRSDRGTLQTLGTTWCIGDYRGKVLFIDYPRGERRGGHNSLSCSRAQVRGGRCKATPRVVGRFSFSVR
jgi:hypothetical protein